MRDQYDYQGGRVTAFGDVEAAWRRAEPFLPAMEAMRRRIFYLLLGLCGSVPLVLTFLPLFPRGSIIIFGGLYICGGVWFYNSYQGYKTRFKGEFCRQIFEAAYPDLTYDPVETMTINDFHNAGLWGRADVIYGEDCFVGSVGDQRLRFSEIKAQREVRRGKNKSWTTIFQGVLVCCKTECAHQGGTIVCPAGEFDNLWNRTEVRVQFPGFDRYLQVHTNSPTDAVQLFTPEIGEMLIHMVQKYGPQFRIAIHDSWIYAGFRGVGNFLEPPLTSPLQRQTFMASFQVIETMATFAVDMQRTFNPAIVAQALAAGHDNPFSIAIGDDI